MEVIAMTFHPKKTDFNLSPYTGLTRESWIEAGEYILEGAFRHLKSPEEPMVLPRLETEITYPHKNSTGEQLLTEQKAEIFEGLTRTFFIAAPLIRENPELTLNGINLRDYYKKHILRCCDPQDPYFIGTYEALQEMNGNRDPFRCYQQTVETCALVICLTTTREQIWETYTKAEKDSVANVLTSFGHQNTVPQNWRMFNMLDLAFLYREGYPIRKEIMLDHVQAILNYYVGDGWYRDGHSFDYYSCWAFNVYGPLWNLWYGYEEMPEAAAALEEHSNRLMETYPDFFDRDGFTNMWGRSNIYRFAATSPLAANFLLQDPGRWSEAEYRKKAGRARRVVSGSLMQFLGHRATFTEGLPNMGFYGQFAPLVQGYSCAESPYWFGKAFLCLDLPADHPFWSEPENEGIWEDLKPGDIQTTTLNGPALCFSNHGSTGETILRTGKVVKNQGDIHGMWNYSKLCFHTKFPWEATPAGREDVESQQYVLKDITTGHLARANVTYWAGERDSVLYRRQFFDYRLQDEGHWLQAMNLADFPVARGILRVDRHRLHRRPVELTLGAYGFPDNGTRVEEFTEGTAKAMVLTGTDSQGRPRKMAMSIFSGFETLELVKSRGTNPDSENSLIPVARGTFRNQYDGSEPYLLISQVLTAESTEDFTMDELFPIRRITVSDAGHVGAYGDILLEMKDGTYRKVNFDGIEGCMQL